MLASLTSSVRLSLCNQVNSLEDSALYCSAKLTAVSDDDRLPWNILTVAWVVFDGIEGLSTTDNLTENDVSAVEVRSLIEAEEELATVGARACIGHRKNTTASVLVLEVLIFELATVDGLTTGAVAGSEIASLSHESRNNAMECAA